jgi:phosphoserine aminotransferase
VSTLLDALFGDALTMRRYSSVGGFRISLYNAITESNAEAVASFLTDFMENTAKS